MNALQVFFATIKIVCDQSAPLVKVTGRPHFIDQVKSRVKVTSIAAVKIVVEEQHALAFSRGQNLPPNVIELVSFVTAALGGQRTKSTAEVAVTGGFDVANAT